MEVLREYGIAPPALSKNGARSLMRRRWEAAEIDVDGESEASRGWRGIGSQPYAEDAELT